MGESAIKKERKRSIARYIRLGIQIIELKKLLWKINHTSQFAEGNEPCGFSK